MLPCKLCLHPFFNLLEEMSNVIMIRVILAGHAKNIKQKFVTYINKAKNIFHYC